MINGTHDVRVPYTYSFVYKKFFRRGKVELVDGADHAFKDNEQRAEKIAADFFAANS